MGSDDDLGNCLQNWRCYGRDCMEPLTIPCRLVAQQS
ncbi:hypothetical protein BRADI_3g60115v3 [Brachypodium distachyon]|uniref:Uncharacterized protein n=1 Tax=Brachypodium distachyon TaxID=15368 RepID=A0A2K2D5Y2_BRADI|nr:hypothetical protein BRADI_3g60115v3 [Brachypodium distachyon]